MVVYTNIIIFIILLVCSAFFSASETALVGLNRAKARALADSGKQGKRLEKLKNNPDHFLITILIGNNIANMEHQLLPLPCRWNCSGMPVLQLRPEL